MFGPLKVGSPNRFGFVPIWNMNKDRFEDCAQVANVPFCVRLLGGSAIKGLLLRLPTPKLPAGYVPSVLHNGLDPALVAF